MKTIRAEDIPGHVSVSEFLESLDLSEDVVVEKDGEPRVVLVAPKVMQQRHEAKNRLFAVIDDIRQRNASAVADEILAELETHDHQEQCRP